MGWGNLEGQLRDLAKEYTRPGKLPGHRVLAQRATKRIGKLVSRRIPRSYPV